MSGTDQAIASVVTWTTDHQHRWSGFDQRTERICLQETTDRLSMQHCNSTIIDEEMWILLTTVSREGSLEDGVI